jgi:RNA polymerase sigma-70 factor (ECF subfamily)
MLPLANPNEVGKANYSYSRLPGQTATISAQFRKVKDKDKGTLVDLDYAYTHHAGGSGTMDFAYDAAAQLNMADGRATVHSRWQANGAGRADAKLTSSALPGGATASECWSTVFGSTFFAHSWNPALDYGVEATDCVYVGAGVLQPLIVDSRRSGAILGKPPPTAGTYSIMGQTPHLQLIAGEKGAASEARLPLRELYEKYGGSVYGRCAFLLRDRTKAEDAMQDVFAKALQHYAGFRAEASPLTWLMKIATHHCLNVLRAERAGWRERFERDERARTASDDGPRALEMRDLVVKLLARFDLETQAAAIHYHVDEMTLDEVAAVLGRSVPTVRKRLEEFAAVCGKELR